MTDTLDLSEPITPPEDMAVVEDASVDAPPLELQEKAPVIDAAPPAPPPPFAGVKWRVQVNGNEFGPYSRSRLIEFLKEGRVGAHTLLSCGADAHFVPADQHPQLRWDFNAPRKRKFGEPKRENGETEPPICNFFVSGQLTGDHDFERMVATCGRSAKIADGMWVLRSRLSVHQIRHRLASLMSGDESFVVINATQDRLAWFNISSEADTALRDVWDADEVD